MPIATGLAIGLGAAAIGGSVASSAIGAHAAGKAANAQVDAANHAADLQAKSAKDALDFEKQQYADRQKEIAPWLNAGTWGINSLTDLMKGGAFPDWTEQFNAPTEADMAKEPGYKFGLDQGLKALESTAAARGNLLNGGTAKAETEFAQDYAGTKYGDVYNRSMGEYLNRYNMLKQNQTDKFNRYSMISGTGQMAENQLSNVGTNASNNVSSILLNSSRDIGNDYLNAGAARASGYVGGANSWMSGLSNGTNNIMDLLMMSKLFGKSSGVPLTIG